jgi:hypothetical protein
MSIGVYMTVFRDNCTYELAIQSDRESVMPILAQYKNRWESIANRVYLIDSLDEVRDDSKIISIDEPGVFKNHIRLDSIENLTKEHIRSLLIQTEYKYTDKWEEFEVYLRDMDDTIACDFETTGLKRTDTITHLSIADSETSSVVLVCADNTTTQKALEWLISSEKTQVWHNALFDLSVIYRATGELPRAYEDTQLMWAVINNHVELDKRRVSLKHLAGPVYRDWAISSDLFSQENLYNLNLIKYASIDSSATYYLYKEAMIHPDFQ